MCRVLSLTVFHPVDCSPPGSLATGFTRQEYWTGLPFPSPGDFPDPGIKPALSPALQVDSLPTEPQIHYHTDWYVASGEILIISYLYWVDQKVLTEKPK